MHIAIKFSAVQVSLFLNGRRRQKGVYKRQSVRYSLVKIYSTQAVRIILTQTKHTSQAYNSSNTLNIRIEIKRY